MVLCCWPPADCPVHSRSRLAGGPAASRAPEGWPPGCGGPAGHGGAGGWPAAPVAPWTGCRLAPVSGPANRLPAGESRYAVVPVSSSDAAPPPGPGPATGALSTGAQASPPAGLEYTVKLAQRDAKPAPVPAQRAQTANTRRPLASSAVTRRPPVAICVQVRPALWVAHNCGPNAQPSLRVRNRIWLTPVGPLGPWAGGAWTVRQAAPPESVRRSTMHAGAAGWSHCPAGSDWPITQPVAAPTNVTDSGGGAGATAGTGGPAEAGAGGEPATPVAGCCGGAGAADSAVVPFAWRPVPGAGTTSRGTATAAIPATARAPAAASTIRLVRSLRACLLTRSNVPGGGSSGRTCPPSQVSSSSRGSGTVVPQRRPEPGPGL